jgi:hypothetical protein
MRLVYFIFASGFLGRVQEGCSSASSSSRHPGDRRLVGVLRASGTQLLDSLLVFTALVAGSCIPCQVGRDPTRASAEIGAGRDQTRLAQVADRSERS